MSAGKVGEQEASARDDVNHPAHYAGCGAMCKCGEVIECIQIAENMGFNLGNVIKYIWRSDKKHDPIKDLRKALWYLSREIDKRGGG